jgi:hypothetical protein
MAVHSSVSHPFAKAAKGWGTQFSKTALFPDEELVLRLPHVVIHLQKMTAGTENQANRQGAGPVNTLSAIFLGLWVDISGKCKAGIQQGSVGVAFGALSINLESQ